MLTAVPQDSLKGTAATRLSPKGIGLFYAADDVETAVAEIALHSPYDDVIVGAFKTERDLHILDFSCTRKQRPSIFATDALGRRNWTLTRFVDRFAEKISEPVLLDRRQAVDFSPTQVVAACLQFVPRGALTVLRGPHALPKGEGGTSFYFWVPVPASDQTPTPSQIKRAGTTPTHPLASAFARGHYGTVEACFHTVNCPP